MGNSGYQLVKACQHPGDPVRARVLLKQGAPVNKTDVLNRTPLHLACLYHPELVEFLVNRSNLDAVDHSGSTPLHYACQTSRWAMKPLLERGANVHARNHRGETPLHITCRHALDCVHELLEAGANVNAQDLYGDTPLHIVCIYRRHVRFHLLPDSPLLSDVLIQHGARDTIENEDGKRPMIRKERIEDTDIPIGPCIVCLTHTRVYVYIPCRHYVTCSECGSGMTTCPVCRTLIQERIRVFV